MTEEDHLTYMLRKRDKTISHWNTIMQRNGSFVDFEKPFPIESDTESSQDAKTSKDESATNQNVLSKKKIKKKFKQSKKEKRFPKGRLSQ